MKNLSPALRKNLFYRNQNSCPTVGDPFIYYEEQTETFYLYGTTMGSPLYDFELAFRIYKSKDMASWEFVGHALSYDGVHWPQSDFWAPELIRIGDLYYFYFTAKAPSGTMSTGVAWATTPEGPFSTDFTSFEGGKGVDGTGKPPFDFPWSTIDVSPFLDEDGTEYITFCKNQIYDERYGGNVSTIWGARMKNPFTIDYDTVCPLTEVGRSYVGEQGAYTQEWELSTFEGNNQWNEGSFLIKHDGKYYLSYSVNHCACRYYAIGYGVADSPLGPYVKPGNAMIMGVEKRADQSEEWDYFTGSGHHMFFRVGEERLAAYHTHIVPGQFKFHRSYAIDTFGFAADGSLFINGPTKTWQPQPSALSGYQNVAPLAFLSASDGVKGDLTSLTNGARNRQPYTAAGEVTFSAGASVTFALEKPCRVGAVVVFNSADYATHFKTVAIALGDEETLVTVEPDGINDQKKYVLCGCNATLVPVDDVVTDRVTVTMPTAAQASEIVILAK